MTRNLIIPNVGETFAFFDDGKIKPTRKYTATVVKKIPFKEESKEVVSVWKEHVAGNPNLYADKTPYFVYCSVQVYDEDLCIFVATTDNKWFSIDYPHFWMSGALDIDGSMMEKYNEWYDSEGALK